MASQTKARSGVLTLDDVAADNVNSKTQMGWITWHNRHNSIFASAPDLYQAGKSGSNELLRGLREDFKFGVVTSTRITYNPDDLHARITHYVNSRVKKPVQSKRIIVPVYDNKSIESVLREEEGLLYLQTLFNTNDNAGEIIQILLDLSKKGRGDVRIWTPGQEDRRDYVEGASCLRSDGGEFHVVGSCRGVDYGRSRGCRKKISVGNEGRK